MIIKPGPIKNLSAAKLAERHAALNERVGSARDVISVASQSTASPQSILALGGEGGFRALVRRVHPTGVEDIASENQVRLLTVASRVVIAAKKSDLGDIRAGAREGSALLRALGLADSPMNSKSERKAAPRSETKAEGSSAARPKSQAATFAEVIAEYVRKRGRALNGDDFETIRLDSRFQWDTDDASASTRFSVFKSAFQEGKVEPEFWYLFRNGEGVTKWDLAANIRRPLTLAELRKEWPHSKRIWDLRLTDALKKGPISLDGLRDLARIAFRQRDDGLLMLSEGLPDALNSRKGEFAKIFTQDAVSLAERIAARRWDTSGVDYWLRFSREASDDFNALGLKLTYSDEVAGPNGDKYVYTYLEKDGRKHAIDQTNMTKHRAWASYNNLHPDAWRYY